MHRENILLRLKEFVELGKSQPAEHVIGFVESEKNCFSGECVSGHVTGSAWLLNPKGDKALLTLHRKLNMWLQLGGHAENETDMLQVAIREAKEESGIDDIKPLSHAIFDVDVHKFPAKNNFPEHYHYDVRFLLQARSDEFEVSAESKALGWFSFEEILAMDADESVKRMARKSLQDIIC